MESGVFALTEDGYGHGNLKAFAKVEQDQPGLLKELGYSVNVNETLDAGIFQAPMGNEPALQAMFEEVKAGM